MQVKWGIAAAGRITHDFVTALGTIPGEYHKVVAVADPEPKRAEEFVKKHQIEQFYGSFEELAKDADVDIIYIGTINPFHYKVTRLMLEHGKNVLCEKPICLSYAEAEELYKLAASKNIFLMEGMWSRCFPSYKKLNTILSAHVIGNVQEILVQHGFMALGLERINTRELGGGIIMDIGIYTLQLGQMVFKKFPEKIYATGTLNKSGVDIESQIVLDYGNGTKLHAEVSGLKNYENNALIIGTKGNILLQNYWCCTKFIEPDGSENEWPLPEGKFEFNHTNGCGLRYEAEEVRSCLGKGLKESPLYTHEESLQIVQLCTEIRRKLCVYYDDILN